MKWQAVITTHRGTGRPDRPVVAQGDTIEEINPMWAWGGVCHVATCDTEQEAQGAVDKAWNEWVVTDDTGRTQWA